ncbi:hypothetical protein FZEAL_9867 [Fusarium zealandicum]|uniref:Uncharacterized protein n=1 Tax=Fusarium zealandicum TaxID=1053134 RepID=A0A8H4U7U4_9HYPO|nr:hypothetical protein FZEAL_9867 [Fusarium zealandicum]
MNSKNWNDRADKDLFFTILSVKNIGVISGGEWTTIGNHMRSLGYGFTNEGCRQHFQGLRRAQNKVEGTGGPNEPTRKVDPTMNPITRRPGPGRGRPRKQPPAPIAGAPGETPANQPLAPAAAGPHTHAPVQAYGVAPHGQAILPQPGPQPGLQPVQQPGSQPLHHPGPQFVHQPGSQPLQQPAHQPMQQPIHQPVPVSASDHLTPTPPLTAADSSNLPPTGAPATFSSPSHGPDLPQNPPHLHPLQHGQPTQDPQHEPPQGLREATDINVTPQPPSVEPNNGPPSGSAESPEQLDQVNELNQLNEDVDADGDADADADGDDDEPEAKRPRLSSPDPSKDVMDDEAVLALAAHNGSTDSFPSDNIETAPLPRPLTTPQHADQTDKKKNIMAPGTDWENAEFLMDLGVALFTACQANKTLNPAVKEAVGDYLKERGYTTSFDAVRILISHLLSLHSHQALGCITTTSLLLLAQHSTSSLALRQRGIMSKRQIMQWDASVHEDILICVFQHLKLSNQEWGEVMVDLQGMGYTFSGGALRYELLLICCLSLSFFLTSTIMSGKVGRGWDATSHEDLLLAFMEEIKPNKAIITSVTEKMRDKGYSYSYDAINQHVQKLRKNRDASGIQNAAVASGTATPRKKAAATGVRKRTPISKKTKAAAAPADEEDAEDAEDEKRKLKVEDEDNGDDITSPSPAKRAKTITPKPEPMDSEPGSGEF